MAAKLRYKRSGRPRISFNTTAVAALYSAQAMVYHGRAGYGMPSSA